VGILIDDYKEKVPLEDIVEKHELVLFDSNVIIPVNTLSDLFYDVNNYLEFGSFYDLLNNAFQSFQSRRDFLNSHENAVFVKGVKDELGNFAVVLSKFLNKFQRCKTNRNYGVHYRDLKHKSNPRTVRRSNHDISYIQTSHDALAILNNYYLGVQECVQSLNLYEGNRIIIPKLKGKFFSDVNYSIIEAAIGSVFKDHQNVGIVTRNSNLTRILHFTLGYLSHSRQDLFEKANNDITLYFMDPLGIEPVGFKINFELQQENNPCNYEPNNRTGDNL